jgi:uncharacterized short protein YbdD (DUF466 family)
MRTRPMIWKPNLHPLVTALPKIWQYLRVACGECDYERYVERARALGAEPMTPQEFYLSQLEHKHSRPTRCC